MKGTGSEQDFIKSHKHFKLGPYNSGYLAALSFFRGSCKTRQPRSKNLYTINFVILDLFVASEVQRG